MANNMYDWVDKDRRNFIGGTCPHECVYCLPGETKILMADYTEKYIRNVLVGDKIIGVQESNTTGYRRFVKSSVLKLSRRIDKTISIETDDGYIECTKEHRLMGGTEKRHGVDWKQAKAFSPYETIKYVGVPLHKGADHKLGYIKGFIDGDGCIHEQTSKYNKKYLSFEAVCVDDQLRNHFIDLVDEFDIKLKIGIKRSSKNSYGGDCIMVRTGVTSDVKRLKEISKFQNGKISFAMGYLAGMLDTDGSVSGGSIRIAQSRSVNFKKYINIINCCKLLELKYVEEKDVIRILSSFDIRMKFLFEYGVSHSTKRDNLLIGYSIKGSKRSKIQSIKIGKSEEYVYNLKTDCESYIANGFIVHNCYVKSMHYPAVKERYSGKIRLFENEFKKPLKSKSGKPIFVGSCFDMWIAPKDMIYKVIDYLLKFDNKYVVQSKDPNRFSPGILLPRVAFGTTVESNRDYKISGAPDIATRLRAMSFFSIRHEEVFLTIEPILDFDLDKFVEQIKAAEPSFVNIGADSKNHNLPEPSWDKVQYLIAELKTFTEVKVKSNLDRLKK